jgi:hypothetical protein
LPALEPLLVRRILVNEPLPSAYIRRTYPFLHIIGGQRPSLFLYNATLQHAVRLADNRSWDTGKDVRVIDKRGIVLYHAEGGD